MDSDTFCQSDAEVIEGNTNTPKREKDDELTSLSWLQNSNLLSGTVLLPIKLQLTTVNPHNDSLENNCSNTNENSTSFINDLNNSSKNNEKSKTANSSMRHDDKIISNLDDLKVANCNQDQANNVANEISIKTSTKFDFELKGEELQIAEEVKNNQLLVSNQNRKLPVSVKPPLSFSCLIFMAIENSTTKALPVKDIYSWIINQYPYYRSAPSGWKNSVRHNLSLNKCFSKVEKSNLGKGSLWMVDPNYRPNLLQAMSKAPIRALGLTDYVDSNLDELSIMKNINGVPNDDKSKSSSLAHLVTSNKIHSSSSSKQLKTSGVPLPDHQQMPFNGHRTKNSLSIIDTSIRALSNSSGVSNTTSVYAADRLRSTSEYKERNSSRLDGCSTHSFNNMKSNDVVNGFDAFSMGLVPSEDVDAATAMLTLKHGRHAFRYSSNHDNLNGLSLIFPSKTVSNHDHLKRLEGVDKMVNDDSKTMDVSVSEPEIADMSNRLPTSISHFSNSFDPHPMEFKHFGETDALLNLAAVATSLASNDISYQDFNDKNSLELETANLFSEKWCLNGKPEVSIQPIQNGQNFSYPIETPNKLTNGKFLENGIGAFSSRRSQLESQKEVLSKKKRDLTDGRLTPKHVKNSKQSLLTKKSSTNHSKISPKKFIRLKDGHTRKTLIRCKKVLKENNNNKLSFGSKSKKVIKKSKNLFYKSLNKMVKRN